MMVYFKGAMSRRMVHLEKIGHFFQVRRYQSVLIFSILVPVWVIITFLVFSTLVNYYFEASFLQFEGDLALGKNNGLKYRDR